jgi:hypothetical protein
MEKKTYETPQLQCLGSVQELTAFVIVPPTNCSAVGDDFSTVDSACEIPT